MVGLNLITAIALTLLVSSSSLVGECKQAIYFPVIGLNSLKVPLNSPTARNLPSGSKAMLEISSFVLPMTCGLARSLKQDLAERFTLT